ncbi:MAG: transcription elongation factor GreA [Candidatus Saccharimonadales bacterium]|jgi:transcription elongation factor GreA
MKDKFQLTADGVTELEQEMEALVADRSNVSAKIKLAREFGDLSENAEYSAVRQEQERAEIRISEIDHVLKNSKIISAPKKNDIVQLGNTVELKNAKGTKKFTIVGSVEADPMAGKISNESPIGQALIGKKLGEEVEIVTPAETTSYKIASIQ